MSPNGPSCCSAPSTATHATDASRWPRGVLGLVAGPGEDGAAGVEGDRGADREVRAADDADDEGAVVGGTVGLDVEDGVVAVVAVGRHPAGQGVGGGGADGGS